MSFPSWVRDAACAGTDPEMFFPLQGAQPTKVVESRRICGRCPVLVQCEEASANERYGTWAGQTASERIRNRRRSA